MEWTDRGLILSVARHGEHDARLELLTAQHGRNFGIVKGGLSRRLRGILQPGNHLQVVWRARIDTQLGTYVAEPLSAHTLALSRDPGRLLALTSCLALSALTLPEREVHGAVYDGLLAVVNLLDQADDDLPSRLMWGTGVVRWELGLLRDLGFGLDLAVCAATGQSEDLTHVSPRSGRAVSRIPAAPYADRLLPLPGFLALSGAQAADMRDIRDGLRLTGYFLNRNLLEPHGRAMPLPRLRLADYVARQPAP